MVSRLDDAFVRDRMSTCVRRMRWPHAALAALMHTTGHWGSASERRRLYRSDSSIIQLSEYLSADLYDLINTHLRSTLAGGRRSGRAGQRPHTAPALARDYPIANIQIAESIRYLSDWSAVDNSRRSPHGAGREGSRSRGEPREKWRDTMLN